MKDLIVEPTKDGRVTISMQDLDRILRGSTSLPCRQGVAGLLHYKGTVTSMSLLEECERVAVSIDTKDGVHQQVRIPIPDAQALSVGCDVSLDLSISRLSGSEGE